MKANNLLPILILLCCTISSTALFAQKDTTKYFEGEVIYDIEYISKNVLVTNNQLKEKFGSKMVYIFKEGSYVKKFFSPSGRLLTDRWVDEKTSKQFIRSNNSDTIYWYYLNFKNDFSGFYILNDSVISGYNCKRVYTEGKLYDAVNKKDVKIKNYLSYASELPVNPDWYSKKDKNILNDIYLYAKGILVESNEDIVYYRIIKKIKTVKRRKVKDKELKIKIKDERFLKEIK